MLLDVPADLRGISATGIVVDEISFVKPVILEDVVCPLMTVEHTSVMALTSPVDETNAASRLIDILDPLTGQPVFLALSSAMCTPCLRDPGVQRCPHKRPRLPGQLSGAGVRAARAVLGDGSVKTRRELEGQMAGEREYLLRPFVDDLRQRERWLLRSPTLVFTFVDPSPGANLSDFAVLSVVRVAQHPVQFVVVGLDTYAGDGSGQNWNKGHELLMRHMHGLWMHPALHQAHYVVIMEANHHVDAVGDYTRKLSDYFFKHKRQSYLFHEKAMPNADAYGVLLDERAKWNMATRCRNLLQAGVISASQGLVGREAEAHWRLLLEQLKTVYTLGKPAPSGEIKYLIKSDGKDDLAICLMSALYHEDRMTRAGPESRFRQWALAMGLVVPAQFNPRKRPFG